MKLFAYRALAPLLLILLAFSLGAESSQGELSEAPEQQTPAAITKTIINKRSLQVDLTKRRSVAEFFRKHYVPYGKVPNKWSGSTTSCSVGNNSKAYKQATLQQLRFYRAMAGVPTDVDFAEKFNGPARAAALMMQAKNNLSHGPPPSWPCYTAQGKKGAQSSNLCLGCVGPNAISAYVRDSNVRAVGHRVWALHPRQKVLGSGSSKRAHALYVFGDWRPEAEVAHIKSVAWPPAGHVPYQLGFSPEYPWSFYVVKGKEIDHSKARISMRMKGRRVSVYKEQNKHILVWYPRGLPRIKKGKKKEDTAITVNISNIVVDGESKAFKYKVKFINPEAVLTEDSEEETEVYIDPRLSRRLLVNSKMGQAYKVRVLLRVGADPNARYQGCSALIYAAYYGHYDIVKMLLAAGAKADYKYKNLTAAVFAKSQGHMKIWRFLSKQTGEADDVPQVLHRQRLELPRP